METRYQEKKKEAAESRKRKLEATRAQELLDRNDKVIRRNDIIVNQAVGKIKLEVPESAEDMTSVVKQEEADDWSANVMISGGGVFGNVKLECVDQAETPENEHSNDTQDKEVLIDKIRQLEAQLASEVKTTANLRSQVDKVEGILEEKGMEVSSLIQTCSSLRVQEENLKKLLEEKDKQLSSEIKTSASLRVQLSGTDELLVEKNAEIKHLREVLVTKSDSAVRPSKNATTAAGLDPGHAGQTSPEQKVLEHFKNVLKIMLELDKSHCNCRIRWSIWKKNLLKKCRLVCKSWKESVDQILEEDPLHMALIEENHFLAFSKKHETLWPLILSIKNLDPTSSVILETLKSFPVGDLESASSNYNPLPSRNLIIDIKHVNDFPRKWNDYYAFVTRYLQVFGKQLWYLTVSIDQRDGEGPGLGLEDFTAIFQCLPNWFQQVPNTKSLTIEVPKRYFPRISADVLTNLELVIDQLSFPRLEHLITFQCGWSISALFHAILKNNRQIQKLSITVGDDDDAACNKILEMAFPNLSELMCDLSDSAEYWEMFARVSWKLEKLKVKILGPPLKDVLIGLEKFRDTLQFLTIDLYDIEGMDTLPEAKLDLPRLRALTIMDAIWEPHAWEGIVAQLENLETFSLELFDVKPFDGFESPSSESGKAFLEYVNKFGYKPEWMKHVKLGCVKFRLTLGDDHKQIEKRKVFRVERVCKPTVRFDVVTVSEKEFDDIYKD